MPPCPASNTVSKFILLNKCSHRKGADFKIVMNFLSVYSLDSGVYFIKLLGQNIFSFRNLTFLCSFVKYLLNFSELSIFQVLVIHYQIKTNSSSWNDLITIEGNKSINVLPNLSCKWYGKMQHSGLECWESQIRKRS